MTKKKKEDKKNKQQAAEELQPEVMAPEEGAEAEKKEETSAEELSDRLLRLQADFDNFRKRTRREREDWYRAANEDIVSEMLPVLDHFEMGLETARQHNADESVLKGFEMVYDQMLSGLAKFGLTAIETLGEAFDPHQQEAISHMPSADFPADTVMAQTRRGYVLRDKLIRPAQVVVSSGAPEAPAEPEDTPES